MLNARDKYQVTSIGIKSAYVVAYLLSDTCYLILYSSYFVTCYLILDT